MQKKYEAVDSSKKLSSQLAVLSGLLHLMSKALIKQW